MPSGATLDGSIEHHGEQRKCGEGDENNALVAAFGPGLGCPEPASFSHCSLSSARVVRVNLRWDIIFARLHLTRSATPKMHPVCRSI